MKIIIRENGKVKAKIESNKYGVEFFTILNGYQWHGQIMTPELAKLSVEVLEKYLDGGWDNTDFKG